MYGKELILDLYRCDSSLFTRELIEQWLVELCKLIDMNREDLHFWDYEGDEEGERDAPIHLQGTSAIQFITTSNVTVHGISGLSECYVNIFSCKTFDDSEAANFTVNFFKAKVYDAQVIQRGKYSEHDYEKV